MAWNGHVTPDKIRNFEFEIEDSSNVCGRSVIIMIIVSIFQLTYESTQVPSITSISSQESSSSSSSESLGFDSFDGFGKFLSELEYFCPSPPPTFNFQEDRRQQRLFVDDEDDEPEATAKDSSKLDQVVEEDSSKFSTGMLKKSSLSRPLALKRENPSPHDFLIHPLQSFQPVHQEATYYLETIRPNFYQQTKIDICKSFMIRIEHPHGFLEQYPLTRDHQNRPSCSFMPKVPGVYVLSVVLTHPPSNTSHKHRIEVGSYSTFYIGRSRNYDQARLTSFHLNFNHRPPLFLQKPWGIEVDQRTNLVYVADREAHSIIVFDFSTGKVVNVFGRGKGDGPGQLCRPSGLAICGDRLFVSDKDNHRIAIFSLDGRKIYPPIGTHGNRDGQLHYPWGIAISPQGNILAVCDSRNFRLQLFDTVSGSYLRKYTWYEFKPFEYKTEFYFPRGVIFDNKGENLFVADFNLQTVFKLDLGLTCKTKFFEKPLHRPQGLAIDEAGNVLICDSRNNCIRIVDPSGKLVRTVETVGRQRFMEPTDISILNDGQVIIVNSKGVIKIF